MFDGYKDTHDLPTSEDLGKFIPQSEIEAWWRSLQKKYPKIYKDEPCPVQHPAGTKLMCYEDDDPTKPVRVEVAGSRWRRDARMGQQAMYVVLPQGGGPPRETELSSCHEEDPAIGWCLGWDAPCPAREINLDEERERREHL